MKKKKKICKECGQDAIDNTGNTGSIYVVIRRPEGCAIPICSSCYLKIPRNEKISLDKTPKNGFIINMAKIIGGKMKNVASICGISRKTANSHLPKATVLG